MRKILVTGGTGQVGNELKLLIPDAIFVSTKECNLLVKGQVESLIKDLSPEIVIHTAARVGGIMDNISHQTEYYSENVLMDTNLISSCTSFGVKKFIGILSTCAYPDVSAKYPMKESEIHDGKPADTNFSYGIAKRGMAVYIDAIRKQYGWQYSYVIPCNLYGVFDKFNERSHFIGALLLKIHKANLEGKKEIELYGTGKPLRQVLYAKDLASVIKQMVERDIYENFNVASNENFSINQYAESILNVLGFNDWNIKYDSAKPDGQFRKDVSLFKFNNLFPEFEFTPLNVGIREVFESLSNSKISI